VLVHSLVGGRPIEGEKASEVGGSASDLFDRIAELESDEVVQLLDAFRAAHG
jgi:hypothetical protein